MQIIDHPTDSHHIMTRLSKPLLLASIIFIFHFSIRQRRKTAVMLALILLGFLLMLPTLWLNLPGF